MQVEQTTQPLFIVQYDVDALTPQMNKSLPVTFDVDVVNFSELKPVTVTHENYESPAEAYVVDERENSDIEYTEQYERAYAAHVIGHSLLSAVTRNIENQLRASSDNAYGDIDRYTTVHIVNSYNFAIFGVRALRSVYLPTIANPLAGNVENSLRLAFREELPLKFFDPERSYMDYDLETADTFAVVNDIFAGDDGYVQNLLVAKIIS